MIEPCGILLKDNVAPDCLKKVDDLVKKALQVAEGSGRKPVLDYHADCPGTNLTISTAETPEESGILGGFFKVVSDYYLAKGAPADDRYHLLNSCEFTVPEGYDHGTQLASFAKFAKLKSERFYGYNSDITDENFGKATNRLVPGRTYLAKFFGIRQRVTSEDNLDFLKSQRAILVGAQGESLVRQVKKDAFPVGKWTVSFDEKDALWEDAGGGRRVPSVGRYSGGDWGFSLGYFEDGWVGDDCLLCVCDLSA